MTALRGSPEFRDAVVEAAALLGIAERQIEKDAGRRRPGNRAQCLRAPSPHPGRAAPRGDHDGRSGPLPLRARPSRSDQCGFQERRGPESALADRSFGPEDPLSFLALPRPLSDRDQAMVHMRASGAGLTAIARHFGISRTRVEQIPDRAEQRCD